MGKALLREAAANVLRVSMELGGCAPFIVFDDADLERAVAAAKSAKLRNMGEACNAANRFYVAHELADEFATEARHRIQRACGRGWSRPRNRYRAHHHL